MTSAQTLSLTDAPLDIAALTCEHFVPLVGQAFTMTAALAAGEVSLPTVLMEAKVSPHPPFNGRQGFALTFTGPAQPVWPQGTYSLTHGAWDQGLDIFIVPVAADAQCVSYQAIFN
jgi:hypothetical protein